MSEDPDPVRLRDDPSAGETGRALQGLGLADFSDFDPAASLPRFEAAKDEISVDAPETEIPVESPSEAGAVSNGVALSKMAKGILLALGVAVPIALVLPRGDQDEDRPPPHAPSATPASEPATPPPAVRSESTPQQEEPPDLVLSGPHPPTPTSRRSQADDNRGRAKPASRDRPRQSRPSLPPDLARREIRATNEMRRALKTDPARTLRLAEEGDIEFRGGMFGHERTAYAVLALVELGRVEEAKRRAERFLAKHPKGALSERVQRAIAGN